MAQLIIKWGAILGYNLGLFIYGYYLIVDTLCHDWVIPVWVMLLVICRLVRILFSL